MERAARQYHPERRRVNRQDPRGRRKPAPRPKPKIVKNPLYDTVVKRDKGIHGVFRRGHIFFVYPIKSSMYQFPIRIILTVLVIVICALIVVLTDSQLTTVRNEINRANLQVRQLSDEHTRLNSQLAGLYTLDQVAYLATTRLGMTPPDPSQIIEIHVPPQGFVMLNRSEEALPRENYFWADMRAFVSQLFNRALGGN